jgi:hypothetical protein
MWQWGAKIAQVTDGTSNTIAATEVLTSGTVTDDRGAWGHPAGCGVALNFDPSVTPAGPPMRINGDALNVNHRDRPSHCESVAGDRQLNCVDASNGIDANIAPRSRHVGGVHAALLDGSVRFINENTQTFIVAALFTIGNGEPPGNF